MEQGVKNGVKGAAKTLPGFLGTGAQTYGIGDLNISKGQKEYIKKLETKGETPEKIEASRSLFQHIKAAPSKESASDEVKKALESGNYEQAKKLAKEYNTAYANSFKDWNAKYKQHSDGTLVKEYNKGKITNETLKRWLADIKKGETLW